MGRRITLKRSGASLKPERYIFDPNIGLIATRSTKGPIDREKQEPQYKEPPSAEEWIEALNTRNIQPQADGELDAQSKLLLSRLAGINPGSEISIQSSQLPGGVGVVRVGPTSTADIQGITSIVGAFTWRCTVTILEGWKGSKFASGTFTLANVYNVPLQGKCIPVKGDFIVAVVTQTVSPNTARLRMSATIEPGDPRRMEEQRDSSASILVQTFAPSWATCFSVAPSGGVVVGDNVVISNANNSSVLSTIPASAIGVYPLGVGGFRVAYSPAGAPGGFLTWTFYGWK